MSNEASIAAPLSVKLLGEAGETAEAVIVSMPRMPEAWRRVAHGSGLAMAGADKRQLGEDVESIGVYLLAAIGLIQYPRTSCCRRVT